MSDFKIRFSLAFDFNKLFYIIKVMQNPSGSFNTQRFFVSLRWRRRGEKSNQWHMMQCMRLPIYLVKFFQLIAHLPRSEFKDGSSLWWKPFFGRASYLVKAFCCESYLVFFYFVVPHAANLLLPVRKIPGHQFKTGMRMFPAKLQIFKLNMNVGNFLYLGYIINSQK